MMNDIPDLITVAKNGNLQEVERLLRQNFSVHIRGKDDDTALYWSSCRGHVHICKVLIDNGSDVNARVAWGSTALHAAADRGHIPCVDLLIRRGANINIQNKRGDTALHVGAYRGHIEIVRLLVNARIDLFIKNDKCRRAVDEAEGNSHHRTAQFLYQHMHTLSQSPFEDFRATNLGTHRPNLLGSSRPVQGQSSHQGQGHNSIGSIPGRFGKLETQHYYSDELQATEDNSCNSFPGASVEKGKNWDGNFLRYRNDLTGFRRRTEPEESMDAEAVPSSDVGENKENVKCKFNRPESLNGNHDNGISELHMRHNGVQVPKDGSDRNENGGQIDNMLSSFQPCNPPNFSTNNGNGGLSYLGSCGDMRMPGQGVVTSARPSLTSVGCVREVAGTMHKESIENFSETLQMELFKTQEMVKELQKENVKMEHQLTTLKQHIQQYASGCHLLKQDNLRLVQEAQIARAQRTQHTTSPRSLRGFIDFLDGVSRGGGACSHGDEMLLILKKSLHSHLLQYVPPSQLDVPNKEWFPGQDFVLIGEQPINQTADGNRDGSRSLVFQIKCKGHVRILKMMINFINLETNGHDQGYSLEHFQAKNFGSEHALPAALNEHVNIIKVRHRYIGTTDRFRKYLSLLIPSKVDVPIEMTSRTAFVVLDYFSESLKSLAVRLRTGHSEPPFGLDITFLLQLLYQLLSAVYFIQKNGVIHRDIKADNVFLDNHLRPVLADFGMARNTVQRESSILFTNNQQVCAGNAHAWAPELTRWNRDGPPQSFGERMPLTEIYSKSDAYAVSRMFYNLLRPSLEGDTFPQSSRDRPHYENSDIPELPTHYPAGLRFVLRNLVRNHPQDRMTDRKAMLYVGMLMFPPRPDDVTVETETARYCQARMLKLLSLDNNARCNDVTSGPRLTMSESVERLAPEIEADFLYNVTPKEFWDIYQDLKQRDCLLV